MQADSSRSSFSTIRASTDSGYYRHVRIPNGPSGRKIRTGHGGRPFKSVINFGLVWPPIRLQECRERREFTDAEIENKRKEAMLRFPQEAKSLMSSM